MKFVSKGLLGLGAATLAVAPLALSATSSGAQAVEPIVVQFTTPGSSDFTVPDGVQCIAVEAIGAVGGIGSSSFGSGGLGGEVQSDLQVLPGQALQVNVGGKGGDGSGATAGAGGVNGGGAGGVSNDSGGGGGGGASDVRQGGTSLTDRVAVGAGGGGSGSFGDVETSTSGGEGGTVGGDGESGAGSNGGHGATVSAGGAGAASVTDTPAADGQSGVSGQGGTGGGSLSDDAGAGGGGGGWFGGGGGGGESSGLPGAGGGGSNFIANGSGSSNTGVGAGNDGDGRVTISYTPGDTSCIAAPLTVTKSIAGAPAPAAGTEFTITVQCLDSTIDLGSVGRAGTASSVDLTFVVGSDGQAHPTVTDTISFVEENQCTVLESDAGGAASTTYACSGTGAVQAGAAATGSWGVSDQAIVAPGDPCTANGPQADPITVNILTSRQEATVTVQNTFAAAAAAVTPRFTG